jgi:hypothetical protein
MNDINPDREIGAMDCFGLGPVLFLPEFGFAGVEGDERCQVEGLDVYVAGLVGDQRLGLAPVFVFVAVVVFLEVLVVEFLLPEVFLVALLVVLLVLVIVVIELAAACYLKILLDVPVLTAVAGAPPAFGRVVFLFGGEGVVGGVRLAEVGRFDRGMRLLGVLVEPHV